MMKMDIGKGMVVYTKGVESLIKQGRIDLTDVNTLFNRHMVGDWTLEEMEIEDIEMNRLALNLGTEDRVFSVFHHKGVKFYIITEWDRSATTMLLPSEY